MRRKTDKEIRKATEIKHNRKINQKRDAKINKKYGKASAANIEPYKTV